MKNFIKPGNTLTLTAPAGGCKSGDFIIVGATAGVAAFDAVAGADIEVTLTGVFELPKATGALNEGAAVSWDNTAHNAVTPGTGKFPIGVVARAAASADTTVRVRLNGVATAAA